MSISLRNRPRNNKWSTSIINQHRIDLIDNGIVVFSLNQIFRRMSHVISQVIKTKLVIGSVSNIGFVGFASLRRIGLMIVNAIYGKSVEFEKWCFPGTIPFCQIVVYGNQMHTIPGKGIQIQRKCSYEGFSFSSLHFCNFTLVQNRSTNE